MKQQVKDLETLEKIAHRIVSALRPRDQATLITLSGELGAGKTTFSQMVGKGLHIYENMVSPTFVLEKVYPLTGVEGFSKLVHIDAYRLEGAEELSTLGFSELLQDPQNIILLEWPEKVKDGLPTPTIAITLEVQDDGTRTYNEVYGE